MKISLVDVNNSSGLYSHVIGRLKDYTLIITIEFPILLYLFCGLVEQGLRQKTRSSASG